jgi:hypothetical protein
MGGKDMKEVEISTLIDYLEQIKKIKEDLSSDGNMADFVFRGQPADFPLKPKLSRLTARGDVLQIEKLLLNEFKRSNPLLIRSQLPKDDWDYLTLGQHFGLPTRFLDWSDNALTAIWFATTPQENGIRECGIVWILLAEEKDYDLDIEQVHPFDVQEIKIVRPRIIRQRINNQSGIFTISSSDDLKEKRSMNENERFRKKLTKVKIPFGIFTEIRNELHMLGVNAFSIYPELEGLCSYLQWRYFE